jgi:hypothetical protein
MNRALHQGFCLSLAAWLTLMVLPSRAGAEDRYTLTISEESLRVVHVDAILTDHQRVLTMDWESASHLSDGWATFVFGLEVRGPDGTEVTVTPGGQAFSPWETICSRSGLSSYRPTARRPGSGHSMC